jgi:hypothetical protein
MNEFVWFLSGVCRAVVGFFWVTRQHRVPSNQRLIAELSGLSGLFGVERVLAIKTRRSARVGLE